MKEIPEEIIEDLKRHGEETAVFADNRELYEKTKNSSLVKQLLWMNSSPAPELISSEVKSMSRNAIAEKDDKDLKPSGLVEIIKN